MVETKRRAFLRGFLHICVYAYVHICILSRYFPAKCGSFQSEKKKFKFERLLKMMNYPYHPTLQALLNDFATPNIEELEPHILNEPLDICIIDELPFSTNYAESDIALYNGYEFPLNDSTSVYFMRNDKDQTDAYIRVKGRDKLILSDITAMELTQLLKHTLSSPRRMMKSELERNEAKLIVRELFAPNY